jgi:hypothetical protein
MDVGDEERTEAGCAGLKRHESSFASVSVAAVYKFCGWQDDDSKS